MSNQTEIIIDSQPDSDDGNQQMINAIEAVCDYHYYDEWSHFLENVEYETKAEWIKKLEGYLVYQYMVLAEYGECVSVNEEVERLWVEFGQQDMEAVAAEAHKERWTVNEPELTNAVEAVCERQAGEKQSHFLENVEYETKAEWIEKLEGHIVYQYMVLSKYGNMEAVAEEVEHLWVDFFAGGICCDWNPEDEAEEEAEEEEEATQELYPQQ